MWLNPLFPPFRSFRERVSVVEPVLLPLPSVQYSPSNAVCWALLTKDPSSLLSVAFRLRLSLCCSLVIFLCASRDYVYKLL